MLVSVHMDTQPHGAEGSTPYMAALSGRFFIHTFGATVRPGAFFHPSQLTKMSSNTTPTPSKNEYRIVTAAELKKIMRKYKYVCIDVKYDRYTRSMLSIDRRYFIDEVEQQREKFDFLYEIDTNYEHTMYIERVIKTPKQPAGGTVDTPVVNLVP
jgi:hypothetical protein